MVDVLESAGAVKFQFYQKVEPNFDQIIHNKEVSYLHTRFVFLSQGH